MKSKSYRFVSSNHCNMCGSGPGDQRHYGRRLDSHQGLRPRRKPGVVTSIFECRRCSLIYANPMPLPLDIAQHYDVDPEQYWREGYFQPDPDYIRSSIEMFQKLTGRPPGSSAALDIGAGIGKAMVALDRAGFDTKGIEPSASFLRAAVDRMGVPAETIQLASVEEASFPDDSFDFINFAAVLEHLADPAAALVKLVGWLNPGGVIYVEVPSSGFLLNRLLRLYYRMTGSDFVANTCPMHPPYHLYEFGLDSFLRHGSRARYSVAHHEYYPCAGVIMRRPLAKVCDALMDRTRTGMQLAVWLRKTPGAD